MARIFDLRSSGLTDYVNMNKQYELDLGPKVSAWTHGTVMTMPYLDKKISYKYNEDVALKELQEYIDSTYDEHYSKNKFQATEFIIDGGHGEGFCIGNILKYAQRYGKKNGKDRRDLLKVIHYGIIALHVNSMENDK